MTISTVKKFGWAFLLSAGLVSAQGASAQSASCEYTIQNDWGGGATAAIEITNTGDSALNGWDVSWSYEDSTITNSWNAEVSGDNPYTATDMGWNGNVEPGQSVSFGVQVDSAAGTETPEVTGDICGDEPRVSSSSSSSSSSEASSSTESSASSVASSVSSSRCAGQGEVCNWYGSHYPLCNDSNTGWGYENGQSCIGATTCSNQPAVYGIEESGSCPDSSSSSSVGESSSSSVAVSSSSSVSSSVSSSGSSSSASAPDGLTSVELTELMGVGWNLGNSLEAVGGETAWGNPEVTQELIDAVKAAGFDTVRIPVAWSKFSDEENFIIESSWMNRVEEVVNYALDAELYVIMNIHWDNGWMQPTYDQQEYVNNRLAIMWEQIAGHFQDYDHELLFAGTNEVMVEGEYGTPTEENYTVQNSFNQTFVDTVRATGGQNDTRHLVVQGYNTNIDHTLNFVEIPDDTVSDRLMMEVHYYDPYNFTLNESSNITQWGSIATDPNATETWANESYVDSQFQSMQAEFVEQGIGVILGEYGVISRDNVEGHDVYRRYWNEYITESAIEHDLVPVYWDNGYAGNGGFALFDRYNGSEIEPELIDILVGADD
ncbi:cellulase family glycosylhydrolase [Marinimicrobium sp. C2-29]|uniref:cellulase family glycosylhydrolase n=1 Tax=Marinimicrobium sp. C2-29 TaxID=3139825 RepID=UPI0031397E45